MHQVHTLLTLNGARPIDLVVENLVLYYFESAVVE